MIETRGVKEMNSTPVTLEKTWMKGAPVKVAPERNQKSVAVAITAKAVAEAHRENLAVVAEGTKRNTRRRKRK